jgi:hypothetical protein
MSACHLLRKFIIVCFCFFMLTVVCGQRAFAISPEQEKRVNALLDLLGKENSTVFIRNGKEYPAEDAVSHLRLKFGKTKKRLETAEQFIDKVGSSSSVSGKPYLIRKPGEEAQPAGPYLHLLLRQADR